MKRKVAGHFSNAKQLQILADHTVDTALILDLKITIYMVTEKAKRHITKVWLSLTSPALG